jgi:hypothetical protein
MGNQERMHISSSLGSAQALASESSSSSDDDFMDEDMEDAYVTTPQITKSATPVGIGAGTGTVAPWLAGSPAVNGLRSFQQRQRNRRQAKKKLRAPLGLGFGSSSAAANLSRSPPSGVSKDGSGAHARRESISWQANQLHISSAGSEGEDSTRNGEGIESVMTTPGRDGQRHVIRRAVTRRGNLLVSLLWTGKS